MGLTGLGFLATVTLGLKLTEIFFVKDKGLFFFSFVLDFLLVCAPFLVVTFLFVRFVVTVAVQM